MSIAIKNLIFTALDPNNDWRFNLLQNWNSIVGSLQTRIRLEKIQGDTLIIGVYESHWMQELFLLSRVLIDAINKNLNEPKVAKIRFKLIEPKSSKLQKNIKLTIRDIPQQVTLSYNQKNALKKIEDHELRQELVRFLARCMHE